MLVARNMQTAAEKLIALTTRPHLNQAERQVATDPFVHLRTFLTALDNPENKIPHYIHVTGTSGKGSTAAYLAQILQANNERVGLTVSPHLLTMRERWQINNQPISPRDFNRLVSALTRAFNQCAAQDKHFGLSFFELCTALALVYFAEQKVTWAVLEVFSGGRVDPTNIIPHKDVAVITTIGLDHQHLLGKTTLKIAREKSGLIKPGALVFTSVREPQLIKAIKTATKHKRAHFVPTSIPTAVTITNKGTQFVVNHQQYRVPAIGAHQARNAALAITIAETLGITRTAIQRGLKNTTLPLRVQIARQKPLVILDGAHNPDKIRATVTALKQLKPAKPLCIIVSFSPTKDIQGMVRELLLLSPTTVIITTAPGPMPSADLATIAACFSKSGLRPTLIPDAHQAWRVAQSHQTILITGSIYLASFLHTRAQK